MIESCCWACSHVVCYLVCVCASIVGNLHNSAKVVEGPLVEYRVPAEQFHVKCKLAWRSIVVSERGVKPHCCMQKEVQDIYHLLLHGNQCRVVELIKESLEHGCNTSGLAPIDEQGTRKRGIGITLAVVVVQSPPRMGRTVLLLVSVLIIL